MPATSIGSMLHHADLPGLPELYSRLSDALNDSHCASVDSVSALIRAEAGMEQRLLRMANSALFQFTSPIKNLDDAIAAIGLPQMCDLAMAVMVVAMLEDLSPDIVSAESHWCHSIACGVAARALAAQRGEKNVVHFFAAGLLHDIGSMLFYVHIPEQSLMAILHNRNGAGPLHHLEQSIVGFDHAQLGGALLHAWGLPEALCEAVTMHHTPELAQHYPLEAATVHLADIMVNAMELGSRGEYVVHPISPVAWERLGLSTDVLQAVMQQADDQFGDVVQALYRD